MSEHDVTVEKRPLGSSGLTVTPLAFGCWPIAGVTTLDANESDSLETIAAALDAGVNHFDNAYIYGRDGESEKLLGRALAGRRDDAVIATKGGIVWRDGKMAQDGRPEALKGQCEESLRRLNTDRVELLYLHSPDPRVPIEESAGALGELQREGKAVSIGASNCSLEQIKAFHAACPIAAVQLPYNLLQRRIERRTLPWCRENGVAAMTYWPLMKGLLADKLPRDGKLAPGDKRATYPIYQGDEWRKNQEFLAELRPIAERLGKTVAEVVINWTIHRPGVTSVLCGAKRAWQFEETAAALTWRLDGEALAGIEAALQRRGEAASDRDFE